MLLTFFKLYQLHLLNAFVFLNTFFRQGQLKLCWENEIDGCNWHNENHDEWTPLMIASYNNHEDAVKILLMKTGLRPKAKWDGMFKIIYFFLVFSL